ncbi:MAG: DNA-binding protein [Betaproteobacteria bacterium]
MSGVYGRTRRGFGRSVTLIAGLTVALWGAAALPALAVSSEELIEEPRRWDQREVTYRGEVIGDVMRRGRMAVLNVNDGTYAMGVWVPVQFVEEIKFAGRHGVKGDTVEVFGVYRRACPEHGGDPDIHADRLTVVEPGELQPEPFYRGEAIVAGLLVAVALFLVEWERRRKLPEAPEAEL